MKKTKNIVILLSILIALMVISAVKIYNTYATGETQDNDTYNFNLTGNTTVTVPRYTYKDVIYQIHNTNSGTIKYGVVFASNNSTTKVKVFTNSTAPATGTIAENDYKYIKLRIENYSDDIETVTLSTILGYENGGDLIVPSGTTLVNTTTDGTYTMISATNSTYFYINTLTRTNIESIEYTKLSNMPVNQNTTNISSDNSVRLWYELNEDTNLYKVYIGSLTGKFKSPSSMTYMFYKLTKVKSLDLTSIDTSLVTSLQYTFWGCESLTYLNLNGWNTEKVTTMEQTFRQCSSLETLDLSSFNTPKLQNMSGTFYLGSKLKKIDMSSFDYSLVTNYNIAFISVPASTEIIVKDCDQYNLFVSKFGSKNGLHTVNNDVCN